MNKNITVLIFVIATATTLSLTRLNCMDLPGGTETGIQTPDQQLEHAAIQLNPHLVEQLLNRGAQPQRALTALRRMAQSGQLSQADIRTWRDIYAQLERSFSLSLAIEREHELRVAFAAKDPYKG